jgi:hypothetical protein
MIVMKRALFILSILALGACGQTTVEAPAPERPAPVDVVQSVAGACTSPEALIDTVGFESLGAVSGYTITAEPGTVACSEPALGAVECAVTGPTAIRVEQSPASFTNYTLAAGQRGTLTVGPSGPACHLNASAN